MTRRSTILFETLGDFWCEAAVLVAVFGLLDDVIKHDRLSLVWTIKTLGCAIVFLSFGTLIRNSARN
jgi:hypothetical protein